MKESVMEDVKAHLKEYTSGKIYLHTMRKVMKEGKAFLREERARRMKMIQEMGVFSKKWGIRDWCECRYPMSKTYLNILNSFMKYDFSGVVKLNGDNFDKIVNGKRSVLCEFYKKDCENCEAFEKEYISFDALRPCP